MYYGSFWSYHLSNWAASNVWDFGGCSKVRCLIFGWLKPTSISASSYCSKFGNIFGFVPPLIICQQNIFRLVCCSSACVCMLLWSPYNGWRFNLFSISNRSNWPPSSISCWPPLAFSYEFRTQFVEWLKWPKRDGRLNCGKSDFTLK